MLARQYGEIMFVFRSCRGTRACADGGRGPNRWVPERLRWTTVHFRSSESQCRVAWEVADTRVTSSREMRQAACKPGSVPAPRRGHGRPFIWDARRRTPRATYPGGAAETPFAGAGRPKALGRPAAPMRSCSRWGLPCRPRCRRRGALLPHHFTLACRRSRGKPAVCFCGTFPEVALAGRYPAPCSRGARTFLPPAVAGRKAAVRPPDARA